MHHGYDQLRQAVFSINPALNEDEWRFLRSGCQIQEYERKSYFISDGEVQTALGFLNSGLIRGYYINNKGEEITIRFVAENGYATHYSAFINAQPSRYYFQCLENCQIVLLPLQTVNRGYAKFKGLERFGRLIAERILAFQQARIEDFQFLDAEQRYRKFTQEYPQLFNRVSLSHLSTYLGIQRPSLSRIRKKIAQE
ncbi:Crp/Fnr family transcriptional regulator [Tunicatimonas pelagia]|uniref:Crp/Fnr family transcriptional regulator n=1 Tax=Tunicatimonas pelagia TaxID=931531 RepID=UPI002665BB5E|nr:Crp/Fnr family transcriptional regulator [Tunicatimonas pelagia]WKN43761.1 Crp/Fnr family transcriptional regulator [Tunicatimonas pelagia]